MRRQVFAAIIAVAVLLCGCQSQYFVPVADTPLFEVLTRPALPRQDNQQYHYGDYDDDYYRFHDKDHGKKK